MTRGRLILVGSGEFTAAMDDLDREILAGIPRPRPRVAVAPTASGLEDTPPIWAELGKTHFAALGADLVPVMVLRRDDARDSRWIDALRDVDWIYFSGGSPQHAINVLSGTPFWDEVLRRHRSGAVLAGSSAGAMMLGEKSYAPDDFDAERASTARIDTRRARRARWPFRRPAFRPPLAAPTRACRRVDRGVAGWAPRHRDR